MWCGEVLGKSIVAADLAGAVHDNAGGIRTLAGSSIIAHFRVAAAGTTALRDGAVGAGMTYIVRLPRPGSMAVTGSMRLSSEEPLRGWCGCAKGGAHGVTHPAWGRNVAGLLPMLPIFQRAMQLNAECGMGSAEWKVETSNIEHRTLNIE